MAFNQFVGHLAGRCLTVAGDDIPYTVQSHPLLGGVNRFVQTVGIEHHHGVFAELELLRLEVIVLLIAERNVGYHFHHAPRAAV